MSYPISSSPTVPPDALERTVERFARLLRTAARRRGLAAEDFDEIVQDVRIRLWRAQQRGENVDGLPASYIYRTACSAAVDLIRRHRAQPHGRSEVEALENGPAALGRVAPADQLAERRELGDLIRHEVERLPESRGIVVRLYLTGYRREEVARMLGWTEARTRNLLYRGLADLRQALRARGLSPETTG